MQFAVYVWETFKTRNYVRFFQLFTKKRDEKKSSKSKSANVLQACLLSKHVSNARLEALKVFCRVFRGTTVGESLFPLSELTTLLAFNNDDETAEFVEFCGLQVMIVIVITIVMFAFVHKEIALSLSIVVLLF